MQVIDHRKLYRLAVIQGLSHREIARVVYDGTKAHSYITRILNGKVKTVTPDAAVRWAHLYGVAVDDLFVTRSTGVLGRSDRKAAA